MSFDWKSYIQLAGELINLQTTSSIREAYLRSAISRSYYGVFCIARNFLRRRTTIPPLDTHKFVRTKYKTSPNRIERKIGDDLGRLWHERKNADYEDSLIVDINMSKTAYQLAMRTLGELKSIGAI